MYYNLKTEERETLYMLQFEELRLALLAQEGELPHDHWSAQRLCLR